MTPGPWGLRGCQIRANDGRGAHVATYMIERADGVAIAFVPEMLDLLRSLVADESTDNAAMVTCSARLLLATLEAAQVSGVDSEKKT